VDLAKGTDATGTSGSGGMLFLPCFRPQQEWQRNYGDNVTQCGLAGKNGSQTPPSIHEMDTGAHAWTNTGKKVEMAFSAETIT